MHLDLQHTLQAVGANFEIPGTFISGQPYGSGHINDTYAVTYRQQDKDLRYIHQRINYRVFKDPVALMDNIARVTRHLGCKLRATGATDIERRALTTIPSRDGLSYHVDPDGNTWRTYIFIEGAKTYDSIETPIQAREAARAFGEFQKQLTDLPGRRLNETIPDFHHTPKRFKKLLAAIQQDSHNRAKEARKEIDFILQRENITGVLLEKHEAGLIPERITHNDTKLNNVMLDDLTMEGICVIDLDTVMPGLALYDFGDMVRTATSPRPEDEQDLSLITMQMPMFKALVDGYLTSAHNFLTATEKEHLTFSGKLITLEIGIRFLTDFLEGDTYFKVKRDRHNLDRCRTQLRLVESIEQNENAMNKVVETWNPKV